jgi:hypothetical protein
MQALALGATLESGQACCFCGALSSLVVISPWRQVLNALYEHWGTRRDGGFNRKDRGRKLMHTLVVTPIGR